MSATSCTAQSERLGVIVDGSSVSGPAAASAGRHRFDRARRNGDSAAPPHSGGQRRRVRGKNPAIRSSVGSFENPREDVGPPTGEEFGASPQPLCTTSTSDCRAPHTASRTAPNAAVAGGPSMSNPHPHHRPAARYRRIRQELEPCPTTLSRITPLSSCCAALYSRRIGIHFVGKRSSSPFFLRARRALESRKTSTRLAAACADPSSQALQMTA